MPHNLITLPRSQLYELVWTKPVRDLAAEFGISDVALAKRCRALKIPVPPRGYWARVAAGQEPRRPALPPFTERKRAMLPSYVTTHTRDGTVATEPAVTFDPQRTNATKTVLEADLPTVTATPGRTLQDCCDLVKRTARHFKHPQRAELQFTRGETNGPILHLAVSPDTLQRALLFADTLLRAAAEQNWQPIPPREPEPPDPRHYYGRPPEPKPNPGPHFVDLQVDGKRIEFSINERFELRELPPTAADLAKQKKYPYLRLEQHHDRVWSGVLRLKRERPPYSYHVDAKSWRETANQTLDAQLPKILADFRAVAARMKDVDDEDDRRERAREEAARLQQELSARRATNEKLIHEFERQAGAWNRAQLLRRYLRAAKRAVGTHGHFVKVDGRKADFLAIAEHYVNQLDPLHPEPRDPDLQHERSFHVGTEDTYRDNERQRLSGHTWERASKLVAAPTESDNDPADDEDEQHDDWDDED